ncbi:hypothetical protein M9Y10_001570 [Tritrichomonas musculus]|uniref:Initiator binding domain-containing protein n=1 Tax=Tritrichomonas musculus TaxID=1915356 RepID=A0ABR2L7C2_9EUKA
MNFASEAENNDLKAKSQNKIKFCLRVFQLLNMTLNDNTQIDKVGLAWCEDGVHFICNSQILGSYIHLKSNSINTNFRAHSFQIESISIEEIRRLFGNLSDIKNWKMRRNVSFPFSTESKENEVKSIPCLEKNRRSFDAISADSNSILPPIIFDLFKNDKYNLHQVEILMKKVDFMPNWKNKFLYKASKDWYSICQKLNKDQYSVNFDSVPASKFIKLIITASEPKLDQKIDIVNSNLNYLLRNSNCNSQSLGDICFIDYLKLCLQFGFFTHIANTIAELSSDNTTSFVSWFIPSTDCNYAQEKMLKNDLNWCLKLSKTCPNNFSILLNSDNNDIVSSHIIFNPMPLKPDQSFFIKEEQEPSIQSRSNITSFIREVLELDIPEDRKSRIERKPVVFVPISNILKENKGKPKKEIEMHHDFADFLSKYDDFEFPDSFDFSNDYSSGSISPQDIFSQKSHNIFSFSSV